MSVSVRKPKKLRLPCSRGFYREAIEATECILLCRNRAESSLANFPRDLVRVIAKTVYETRYSTISMQLCVRSLRGSTTYAFLLKRARDNEQ
jgi:hypothetical protein